MSSRISMPEIRRLGALLAQGASLAMCARALGRDINALRRAAVREGLEYPKHVDLTKAQTERILAAYPNTPTAALAKTLGLTLSTIHRVAARAGASKSPAFFARAGGLP